MSAAYLSGMGMGGGLIIAIGAQNAFVLSQGVRRNHHLTVALVCSLADVMLITLGVTGVGAAFASSAVLSRGAAWGGAAFLLVYGFRAMRSAIRGGRLEAPDNGPQSFRAVLLATLAVTFLNPHCYLDTMVLLGGISSQYAGQARTLFWSGAVTMSFIWFFSLSLGGRALAPLFRKDWTWRILDGSVALVMWTIGLSLVVPR